MKEVDIGHMNHSISENLQNEIEFLVKHICTLEIKYMERQQEI